MNNQLLAPLRKTEIEGVFFKDNSKKEQNCTSAIVSCVTTNQQSLLYIYI